MEHLRYRLCSEATKRDICAIVEYIRKTIGIPYMFSDMNFKVTYLVALSCCISQKQMMNSSYCF